MMVLVSKQHEVTT